MINKHIERYTITIEGNKTIARSTFANYPVYGYAKCDPTDNFNAKYGEDLAKLRCAKKINEKRMRNAMKAFRFAERLQAEAQKMRDNALVYLIDVRREEKEIEQQLEALLLESESFGDV